MAQQYGWYMDATNNRVMDTDEDPFTLIEAAVRARWEDDPDDMLLDMIRVGPLVPAADDPDDQICEGRPALPIEHDGDEWRWESAVCLGCGRAPCCCSKQCRASVDVVTDTDAWPKTLPPQWWWWALAPGQEMDAEPSSGTCATLAEAMTAAEKVMRGE